jgi:hypothetical protein
MRAFKKVVSYYIRVLHTLYSSLCLGEINFYISYLHESLYEIHYRIHPFLFLEGNVTFNIFKKYSYLKTSTYLKCFLVCFSGKTASIQCICKQNMTSSTLKKLISRIALADQFVTNNYLINIYIGESSRR